MVKQKIKNVNKNKQGKYRMVTIVVILLIIMLTFIMAYAPPTGTITGSSVANAVTGYSVFNIPASVSKSGFVLATGMDITNGVLTNTSDLDTDLDKFQQIRMTGASENAALIGSISDAHEIFIGSGQPTGLYVSESHPNDVFDGSGIKVGTVMPNGDIELTSSDGTAQSPQFVLEQPIPLESPDKKAIDNIIKENTALSGYTYSAQGSLVSNNGFVTHDGTVVVKIGNDYVMQSSAGGLFQGPTYIVVDVNQQTGQITPNSGTIVTLTMEQKQQFRQQVRDIQAARQQVRDQYQTQQERIDLQERYQRTQQQFTGKLAGYLSNLLAKSPAHKKLLEVPAKICQNAYGIDYEKSDSWMAVPYNTTPYELGRELVANARTVIINGEKEEITPALLRYAYSLRMLGDKSVEWETYMQNSCTGRDTKSRMYDHGALSAGQHFYFHYAGSQGSMIFNCEQEECVYDLACVKFADEDEPYCVDLTNGAGFITVPTNMYGCD